MCRWVHSQICPRLPSLVSQNLQTHCLLMALVRERARRSLNAFLFSMATLMAADRLGLMMCSSDWSSTGGSHSGSCGCQTQLLLNTLQVLFIDSPKRKQMRSNGFSSTGGWKRHKTPRLQICTHTPEKDKVSKRETENMLSRKDREREREEGKKKVLRIKRINRLIHF